MITASGIYRFDELGLSLGNDGGTFGMFAGAAEYEFDHDDGLFIGVIRLDANELTKNACVLEPRETDDFKRLLRKELATSLADIIIELDDVRDAHRAQYA